MGMSILAEPFGDTNFDTLIIGGGTVIEPSAPGLIEFVRQALGRNRRGAPPRSRAVLLAQSGLLHWRRWATQLFYTRDLQARVPTRQRGGNRPFLPHRPRLTS